MPADEQILALRRRDWLLARRQSENTIGIYQRHVDRFRTDVLEGCPLSETTRLDVDAYVTSQLEISSHVGKMAQRSLKAIFKWLVERDVIPTNPCDGMAAIREEKNPEPATVTHGDMAALRATCAKANSADIRDLAIIETLWAAACRRGELVRMELHHVDLDAGTVLFPITKNGKPRIAPLTETAIDAVAAWLEHRLSWPTAYDQVWLSNHKGQITPMTANGVRLMLERRRRAAGVHVSAHAFRRGAAVAMLRDGISQTSVQAICGWSGPEMVTRYTRAVAQELAIDEYRQRRTG